MRAAITEIVKNNIAVDFSGVGKKRFEYSPVELQDMIEQDLKENYDCITYLSSMVNIEEGLIVDEDIKLTIRLYLKLSGCEDKDSMKAIITQYLKTTFI